MSEHCDFEKINDTTLSAAGVLLIEGRQYEGIEEEKDEWIEEAQKRLNG
jgi:hypothetical protein